MLRGNLILAVCFLPLPVLAGCGATAQSNAGTAPANLQGILVTSPALLDLCTAFLEGTESVRLVVPDVVNSRDWRPTRTAIEKLQRGRLLVLSGADWEPWLQQISFPQSRLLDVSEGLEERLIHLPDVETHRHGSGGLHSHPGYVSQTWLSAGMLLQQLQALELLLAQRLPQLEPANADVNSGAARMREQLRELSAETKRLQDRWSELSLQVVSDGPEYEYLLRDLGWQSVRLHWPRGEEPSESDWQELQTALDTREDSSQALILLHAGRAESTAVKLREQGVQVVRIDLCELLDAEHSVVQRLHGNLQRLSIALDELAQP